MAIIALVEDSKPIANAIAKALEKFGYTVEVFYHAEKFLERCIEKEYDLLILDLMLPEISGEEVLERLASRGVLYRIPVLINSAKAFPELVAEPYPYAKIKIMRKPSRLTEIIKEVKIMLLEREAENKK